MRRNVLIFHQAALGDFVVTWPLAVACGRMFAQSRIVYVTASQKGKLAEHVLGVESADVENGFGGLWSEDPKLSLIAKKWLDGAAAVFSLVADDNSTFANNIRTLAPEARLISLSTKPPVDYDAHVSRFIAEQLVSIDPAIASGVSQMIETFERRGVGRRSCGGDAIVIHPGSGAERKNWGREKFSELAGRLRSSGRTVQVILGEVELEKWGAAARGEFAEIVGAKNVVSPPTLVDLATLLASAAAVVVNDSGPAHLAAALGVKTVAIFGSTSNATHWRPLGPAVRLVTAPDLAHLQVDQVQSALTEVLKAT